MTRSTRLVLVAIAILAPLAPGLAAEAGPARKKSLRAKVAALESELGALRGQLAVLQSQLEFAARRDGSAPGGVSYPAPPSRRTSEVCAGTRAPRTPTATASATARIRAPATPREPIATRRALDCFDPCPDDATDACIDPAARTRTATAPTTAAIPAPGTRAARRRRRGRHPRLPGPVPRRRGEPLLRALPPRPGRRLAEGLRRPVPWGEGPDRPCVYELPPAPMTSAAP